MKEGGRKEGKGKGREGWKGGRQAGRDDGRERKEEEGRKFWLPGQKEAASGRGHPGQE
jgi:hypothetical protein